MPTAYERISESWQLDTLRLGLNFLALENGAKAAYLPDNFSAMTFHMLTSDMVCSNPLVFMAAFCDDACHLDPPPGAVETSLLRIVGVLSSLEYDEHRPYWRTRQVWLGETRWSHSSLHVWDGLRFLAEERPSPTWLDASTAWSLMSRFAQ